MGIFASLIKNKDAYILPEKKHEFSKRMLNLLDKGGMMEVIPYPLCGQSYLTLRRLQESSCMDFYYNYFDDDTSEAAGFDKENLQVWSNKLVGSRFYRVMLAAYALEGIYYSGINIVNDNADLISGNYCIAWLNELFDEKFCSKSADPWDVYVSLKGTEYEDWMDSSRFKCYKGTYIGFLGYLDIIAVEKGITALNKFLNQEKQWLESDLDFYFRSWRCKLFKSFIGSLHKFGKRSMRSKEEQLEYLLGVLRDMYTAEDSLEHCNKYRAESSDDIYLKIWGLSSPAITVKAMAEIYGKDFWCIWDRVGDVATRNLLTKDAENEEEALKVSTEDFLSVSPDDLILYWSTDKPLAFSEEMKAWLLDLKREYDSILYRDIDTKNSLKNIKAILDYAEENYTHIYLFSDFIDETMGNLDKPEFMALWLLFERVLHDEYNLKANQVIWEPAEGYENDKDYIVNRHRACDDWRNLSSEYKFNSGRKNIRRYIALMANKNLRSNILGI